MIPFIQFSENNETLSVLSLVASSEDDNKYLTCRAENKLIPDSAIEDKWRLNVHCKYTYKHTIANILILFIFINGKDIFKSVQ